MNLVDNKLIELEDHQSPKTQIELMLLVQPLPNHMKLQKSQLIVDKNNMMMKT
jgi:hypothetical protein